jgi:uncharacterized protein
VSGDLYNAIMDGDSATFERLAQGGLGASDVTPNEGWNYLHQALMSLRESPPLPMVQRLLDWGVDVNGVDIYGNTPLFYAVRQKTPQAPAIVRCLLAAGADANILNKRDTSPLRESLAKLPINDEVVRALLSAGADMHQRNPGGRSIKEMIDLTPATTPTLKSLFAEFSETNE